MTILTFAKNSVTFDRGLSLNTENVIAVHTLPCRKFANGTVAHCRSVFTKDALVQVWEKSSAFKIVPPDIQELDALGGKQHITAARLRAFERADRDELQNANKIVISTDAADHEDIKRLRYRDTAMAGVTLSGAFTISSKHEKLASGTRMHFALLNLGNHTQIAVAHMDGQRFLGFGGA